MKLASKPVRPALLRAGLAALAVVLLAPATAEARKECRPSEPLESPAEPQEATSAFHWARGNDSSWTHQSDGGWVHEVDDAWLHRESRRKAAESVAYDPNENLGWVHETDYGWWANVPEDGVMGEDEPVAESEQDCTVSKERNECVVLANQVATYRFRLGLAFEREDDLWAESLLETIARLEARAERRQCPWTVQPTVQQQIVETVKALVEAASVAAQVYSMFYRMGLF